MKQYSLLLILLLVLPDQIDGLDELLEGNDFNITSLMADHRALLKSRRVKRACPGGMCGVTGLLRNIGQSVSNLLLMPPMMGPPPPFALGYGRRKKRQFGCCMCCCCCCCCFGRKRRSIEFVRNRRSQLQHFMHISPNS